VARPLTYERACQQLALNLWRYVLQHPDFLKSAYGRGSKTLRDSYSDFEAARKAHFGRPAR